jgi:hypothetical protein
MTDTTRRTVLRVGALVAAAAPLAAPTLAAAASPSAATALPAHVRRLYRRSRFVPLVGATFTLVDTAGRWPVTLTAVDDLPNARRGAETSFGLTFTCGSAGPEQGTFVIRRRRFPATTLFLVPSADRRSYQAVINNG